MSAAPLTIRQRAVILAVGATLALTAPILALGVASKARGATHAVDILDGGYSPASLTVRVGDTVTWTNTDDSPHTVTSGSGAFDSGNLNAGATFSMTFDQPGTFAYICLYHEEMLATVIVEPAAAEPAAPAAPAATARPAANANPTAGGAQGATASHAPGHSAATGGGATGEQPDTAVELPAALPWLAPLLIGLGLVAFAFGLLPMPSAARTPIRTESGWRR